MALSLGLIGLNLTHSRGSVLPSVALTLSELVPEANTRAARMIKVARFTVPDSDAQGENTHRGITSTAGFDVVTCADATALMNALNASNAVDKLTLIYADWDGVSTFEGRLYGVYDTNLVANAAVDWGFDRAANKIFVQPAAGRTPSIHATWLNVGVVQKEMLWLGANIVHFKDMGFSDCGLKITEQNQSSYSTPPILTFEDCSFDRAAYSGTAQVLNMIRPKFYDCINEVTGQVRFFRMDGRLSRGKRHGDGIAIFGFAKAYMTDWLACKWVSNDTVIQTEIVVNDSEDHSDLIQFSTGSDIHAGYSPLIEQAIHYSNKNRLSYNGWQGWFSDDGGGFTGDLTAINVIIAVNSTHGIVWFDPTGTKHSHLSGVMIVRSAIPLDSVSGNSTPLFTRLITEDVVDAGSLQTYNCVGTHIVYAPNGFTESSLNFANHKLTKIDFASLGDANSPDTLQEGDTWTLDARGYPTYVAPDIGVADPDAAKRAVIAYLKPKVGWGDVDGGIGPINPNLWPTNVDDYIDNVPTIPGVINNDMVDLTLGADGLSIDATINRYPATGGAAFTDFMYSTDSGVTKISMGVTDVTDVNLEGFSPGDAPNLSFYAVNSLGTQTLADEQNFSVPSPQTTYVVGGPKFTDPANWPDGLHSFTLELKVAISNVTGTKQFLFYAPASTAGIGIQLRTGEISTTLRTSSGAGGAGSADGYACVNKTMAVSDEAAVNTYRFVADLNGDLRMYFNGVLKATYPLTTGTGFFPNGSKMYFLANGVWAGTFEHMKVWHNQIGVGDAIPETDPDVYIWGNAAAINAHPWKSGTDATDV